MHCCFVLWPPGNRAQKNGAHQNLRAIQCDSKIPEPYLGLFCDLDFTFRHIVLNLWFHPIIDLDDAGRIHCPGLCFTNVIRKKKIARFGLDENHYDRLVMGMADFICAALFPGQRALVNGVRYDSGKNVFHHCNYDTI